MKSYLSPWRPFLGTCHGETCGMTLKWLQCYSTSVVLTICALGIGGNISPVNFDQTIKWPCQFNRTCIDTSAKFGKRGDPRSASHPVGVTISSLKQHPFGELSSWKLTWTKACWRWFYTHHWYLWSHCWGMFYWLSFPWIFDDGLLHYQSIHLYKSVLSAFEESMLNMWLFSRTPKYVKSTYRVRKKYVFCTYPNVYPVPGAYFPVQGAYFPVQKHVKNTYFQGFLGWSWNTGKLQFSSISTCL